ncbi:MAG: hypothetical protein PWQ12_1186 [Clostridiales bacterium]|jgi:hypothetical protein|nr:hypothetical protein [Clostridiales bacterium]
MRLTKISRFILSNILASFGISMSISFFMTLWSATPPEIFLSAWIKSFGAGYVIAVPSSMVFVPVVNKLLDRVASQQM